MHCLQIEFAQRAPWRAGIDPIERVIEPGLNVTAREELIQIQGDVNQTSDRRARVAEVAEQG